MSIKAQYAGLATGLVSMATVFGVAPAAHALDFKISGQVNRAVIAADNGKSTDAGLVDNGSSPTRFAFKGTQDVNPNLKVGFDYELGVFVNKSGTYDVNKSATGTSTDNRQANVFFEGSFGKLTFGKTDGAANSTSKVDLSGLTDLGGGSVVGDYFGGLSFVNGAGQAGPTLKNGYSNFDALSRVNTVRYDTPSFNGATLSVSYDQGQAYEIAPRYEHKFADGVKVAGAVDYVDSGNRNKGINQAGYVSRNEYFHEFGGSASVLLPSGLNFFAQYKRRNYHDTTYSFGGGQIDHAQSYSGGIGYIRGKNHIQAFFGQTDDLESKNSRVRNYGVAYRYDLLKSVNMYASYHHLTGDNLVGSNGNSFNAKNMNVVFAGVRVKFF
ncbi:porin [Salinisphaera sp. RV14]|uniref:porin n=1 Tax=unclassified Salinisphaera TaxID=2649847 RepID=UPI003F843552